MTAVGPADNRDTYDRRQRSLLIQVGARDDDPKRNADDPWWRWTSYPATQASPSVDIVAVIAIGGALVAALLAVQLGVLLADQLGYHREAGLSRPPKHRNNVLFGSGGEVSGGYRA